MTSINPSTVLSLPNAIPFQATPPRSLLIPALTGGVPGSATSRLHLHPTHAFAHSLLLHAQSKMHPALAMVPTASDVPPSYAPLEKAGVRDLDSVHLYTSKQVAILLQEPLDHELRVELRGRLQSFLFSYLNENEMREESALSEPLESFFLTASNELGLDDEDVAKRLSTDVCEALQSEKVKAKLKRGTNAAQQVAHDVASKYFQRDHAGFAVLADKKKAASLAAIKQDLSAKGKIFAVASAKSADAVETLLEENQAHPAHMKKAVHALLLHGYRSIGDVAALSAGECLSLTGFPNYYSALLELNAALSSRGYSLREVQDNELEQLPFDTLVAFPLLNELELTLSHPGKTEKYSFIDLLSHYAEQLKAYVRERSGSEVVTLPDLAMPALADGALINLYHQLSATEKVLLQYETKNEKGYDVLLETRRRELQVLMKALDLTLAKAKMQEMQVLEKLRQLGMNKVHQLTALSMTALQMYKKDLERLVKREKETVEINFPSFSPEEIAMIRAALQLSGKDFSSAYHTTLLPEDLALAADEASEVFYEGAASYLLPPDQGKMPAYDRVPRLKDGSSLANLPSESLAWLTQNGTTATVPFQHLFLSLTLLPAWTEYTPERVNARVPVRVAQVKLVDDGNQERHQVIHAMLSRIRDQGFISLEEARLIREHIIESHGQQRGDELHFVLSDVLVGETHDIALRPEYQVDFTASRLSAYGLERYYDGRFGHSIWRSGLVDPAESPFHLVFLPGCGGAWSCGASGAMLIEAFAKAKASVFSLDLPHHGLSSQGESSLSMDAFMHSLFLYVKSLKAKYAKPLFIMGRSYGANLVEEFDWRYGNTGLLAGKIPLSGFRREWIAYNMNDMADLSKKGLTRLNMDGLMWSRRKAIEHGFQHFGMFENLSRLPEHAQVSPTLYLVGDGDSAYPGASEELWIQVAEARKRQGYAVGTTVIEGAGHNPFLTPTADDPDAVMKRAAASLAMKQVFGFIGKNLKDEWSGGVARLNVEMEMKKDGKRKKK